MLDLSRLSPQQRHAVLAPDGPILIIAGPGSGKTMVLAAKIAYLVTARQIPPASILAITFATKAACELRSRLRGLLGEQGSAVDVSTFHAFGLRIVAAWSEELGMGPGPPVVYAEHEARTLLRGLARDRRIDLDHGPIIQLAAEVDRVRLDGPRTERDRVAIQPLAEAYEETLRRRGAVDYLAMLALPLRLFAERPHILRVCQDSYRFILCDEFQDIAASQYALLRQLAERHHNLTVVGDPLQTLYGWRGADVRFVDEFQHDFAEARTVDLHQNFRSTASIVAVAEALGSVLSHSHPLWTDNPVGEAVRVHAAADEDAETTFVVDEIERLLRDHIIEHAGEVAILYRTNYQALPFTIALRTRDIHYRVQGPGDLFARREVRDVLAYLRLAHNLHDRLALTRIVNVPPRQLARLHDQLREQPVPVSELLDRTVSDGSATLKRATILVTLIRELHDHAATLAIPKLMDQVIARTGYGAWLESQTDGPMRLANLRRLREIAERADGDLGAWLADLQLTADEPPDRHDEDRMLLSTIHRAKGGEWRVVFVVGVEEGLLPHARALKGDGDRQQAIEEERRVAYVAVTRARERLYLTYCQTRQGRERRRPSRFLNGLPLQEIERAA